MKTIFLQTNQNGSFHEPQGTRGIVNAMSILHLTKFYAEVDINHATKLNRHTLVKQESV